MCRFGWSKCANGGRFKQHTRLQRKNRVSGRKMPENWWKKHKTSARKCKIDRFVFVSLVSIHYHFCLRICSRLETETTRAAICLKQLKFIKDNHANFEALKKTYLQVKYLEASGREIIDIKEQACQTAHYQYENFFENHEDLVPVKKCQPKKIKNSMRSNFIFFQNWFRGCPSDDRWDKKHSGTKRNKLGVEQNPRTNVEVQRKQFRKRKQAASSLHSSERSRNWSPENRLQYSRTACHPQLFAKKITNKIRKKS